MSHWEQEISDLVLALDTLLKQPQQQWSEAELLRYLQAKELGFFSDGVFSDSLLLFQAHFVLYHCLYKLQQHYLQQRSMLLEISLARVYLTPWHPGESAMIQGDPLRDYYLDLTNLDKTNRDDVDKLLEQFWQKMARHGAHVDSDKLELAYSELGLSGDEEWPQVRRAYRQLLHQYHPDKGRDIEKTRQIIKAYNTIKLTR